MLPRGQSPSEAQYAAQRLMLPRTLEEIEADLDSYVVVVDANDRVKACAALYEYSPSLGEIGCVAVAREVQGNGLGSLAVRGAEAIARRRGIGELFAMTLTEEFFESMGYAATPVERTTTCGTHWSLMLRSSFCGRVRLVKPEYQRRRKQSSTYNVPEHEGPVAGAPAAAVGTNGGVAHDTRTPRKATVICRKNMETVARSRYKGKLSLENHRIPTDGPSTSERRRLATPSSEHTGASPRGRCPCATGCGSQ